MAVTISKLPCTSDGCTGSGAWTVFDGIEFVGYFCRQHALAEQGRIEKKTRISCAWFKGCTLYGRHEVIVFSCENVLGTLRVRWGQSWDEVET
jgi:hypothetical protein